ncbi:hypothetical protein, partial [Bilophila wadsworthia]|uniref:hypothetical protein n=1 Tax=Bilophila wadsworthia TaxID=35833 RepID=UPI00300F1B91
QKSGTKNLLTAFRDRPGRFLPSTSSKKYSCILADLKKRCYSFFVYSFKVDSVKVIRTFSGFSAFVKGSVFFSKKTFLSTS